MIPTFVFGWPDRKEVGDYLALDLGMTFSHSNLVVTFIEVRVITGGTNLRVCLVTLQGEGKFEVAQAKYRLTEEQKQEEGQKLFDFCAECLKIFLDANVGEDRDSLIKPGQELPLGFTVSHIVL
jgi:hexokinase